MKAKKAAAIKKAAPVKKAVAKKAVVKKAASAKKVVAKKVVAKKVAAKKIAPAKKTTVKKVANKKTTPKKVTTKKKVAARVGGVVRLAVQSRHIIAKSLGRSMAEKFVIEKSSLTGIVFNDAIEFDRDLFEQVLGLPGCVKVRFYNAINSTNGEHTLVITGVDAKKNDIYFNFSNVITNLQGKDATQAVDGGGVGDMGDACPRYEPSVVTLV
jgi:hypothetical protein